MKSKDQKSGKRPNRLIDEKSPYLLQHAYNPVNWFPWSGEAFKKAREEDKPLFLSIGYATCHWCHVMAHESFEDEEVAELLNDRFISMKVDREERPDIDKIYMTSCQAITGQGGWPLTVFMTPAGEPFYAGTYFPKEDRMGMAGLMTLLRQVSDLWKNDRSRIISSASRIINAIKPDPLPKTGTFVIDTDILKKGFLQLSERFDTSHAGFGDKPKFPTPHNLTFLMRYHAAFSEKSSMKMVEMTLNRMRNGGMYDQMGYGFHRYSVDEKWLVPHFEKMLYDQSLLAIAYMEAFQVTGKERFVRVAEEIFHYVLRDMISDTGGFYCAEDADSEGEEGLFYLWSYDEVIKTLGEKDGDLFCRFFNIRKGGNFENGLNIPNITDDIEAFAEHEGIERDVCENIIKKSREILFNMRENRVHPLKDDKILTSWNGLMIAALCRGYQVMERPEYLDAAKKTALFIIANLRTPEGRLLRRYRNGEAAYPGYLDDYAFLVWGLIELYEASFNISFLEEAIALNEEMIAIYWDNENSGFYFTGQGNENLITRIKEIYDGAIPSGNSVAALNLLRLSRMTGDIGLEKKAEELIGAFSSQVAENPMFYTHLLAAVDFMTGTGLEVVIAGDPEQENTQNMIRILRKGFHPNKVVLMHPPGPDSDRIKKIAPFTAEMRAIDGKTALYICENHRCMQPFTDIEKLENYWISETKKVSGLHS